MLCFDPVSVPGAQPTAGYCAAEKGEAQETPRNEMFGSRDGTWLCLKMGYTPNYSHLVGKSIINHWVYGYTIFRQTHLGNFENPLEELWTTDLYIYIHTYNWGFMENHWTKWWILFYGDLTNPNGGKLIGIQ